MMQTKILYNFISNVTSVTPKKENAFFSLSFLHGMSLVDNRILRPYLLFKSLHFLLLLSAVKHCCEKVRGCLTLPCSSLIFKYLDFIQFSVYS